MKHTNIFSKKYRFDTQNKATWKKNIPQIPVANYEGKTYDSIYFQDEISSTHTFNKEEDWHINSEIRLEAPIKLDGLTALSEDIRIKLFTPVSTAAELTTLVPKILLPMPSKIFFSTSVTCL